MHHINELKTILGQFLDWNKARLDCFVKMLLALFAVRTVNLKEIAIALEDHTKIESRYKRLKRFFAGFTFNSHLIAHWIFKIFAFSDRKIYLTIDRTNWCFGKTKINILVLAVAYEGLAIPLFWRFLNKKGNASATEHIEILSCFVNSFGKSCILGVLGDREFASGRLFSWLNSQKIPFYIRIKEHTIICWKRQHMFPAKKVFRNVAQKCATPFGMAIYIFNQKVYLTGSRSERGELMIVATNAQPKQAISIYLLRWEIENFFQGLKTRRFRFEDTHLRHLERIEKLMALLAIAFCWAHKVGEWCAIKKPIIFNKHFNSLRPQNSYFRYGLDLLRDALLHLFSQKNVLKVYIHQLLFLPSSSILLHREST